MPSPLTVRSLLTDAYLEGAIIADGEVMTASQASFALRNMRRLLDKWNVDGLKIFAAEFYELLVVPNVQPATIGQGFPITQATLTNGIATFESVNNLAENDAVDISGCKSSVFNVADVEAINVTPGSFQVAIAGANTGPETESGAMVVYTGTTPPNYPIFTQRPDGIVNANIILNNVSPIVKSPLRIRDADWWMANSVPQTPTTLPTDLYYNPTFPNGQLYLWPLPTQAYGLELQALLNIADLPSLDYSFYLPPAYEDAITLTMGERLCPSFGRSVAPELAANAANARRLLTENNSTAPRQATRDSGLPSGGTRGTFLNWLNGAVVPGRQ